MRAVIQRVSSAEVRIDGNVHARIGMGLLVLLGVEAGDTNAELEWTCGKIGRMRLFPNEAGVMDLDVGQAGGEMMVISQFTLLANIAKGNRPSYIAAARPEEAIPLYEKFCERLSVVFGGEVKRGIFGADMKVDLVNDGPVTIVIDSRVK